MEPKCINKFLAKKYKKAILDKRQPNYTPPPPSQEGKFEFNGKLMKIDMSPDFD